MELRKHQLRVPHRLTSSHCSRRHRSRRHHRIKVWLRCTCQCRLISQSARAVVPELIQRLIPSLESCRDLSKECGAQPQSYRACWYVSGERRLGGLPGKLPRSWATWSRVSRRAGAAQSFTAGAVTLVDDFATPLVESQLARSPCRAHRRRAPGVTLLCVCVCRHAVDCVASAHARCAASV